MRALVLYSAQGELQELAAGIAEGLRRAGARQVDLLAANAGGNSIAVGGYDLVCVGSPVLGRFGGQVADDIDAALKRCTRLNGKQAAAFVTPRLFGTQKSLRTLMGLLEQQGAQVRDFETVASRAQAERFGQRLVFEPNP